MPRLLWVRRGGIRWQRCRLRQAMVERYHPSWAIAYGWENAQLVAELDRLDVPVIVFVDHVSANPSAERQLSKVFLYADEILFSDAHIPRSLTTTGTRGLQARTYTILDLSGDTTIRAPRTSPGGSRKEALERSGRERLAFALVEIGRRAALNRVGAQRTFDEATIRASGLFKSCDLRSEPRFQRRPGTPTTTRAPTKTKARRSGAISACPNARYRGIGPMPVVGFVARAKASIRSSTRPITRSSMRRP